jgi:hypothetical protein
MVKTWKQVIQFAGIPFAFLCSKMFIHFIQWKGWNAMFYNIIIIVLDFKLIFQGAESTV